MKPRWLLLTVSLICLFVLAPASVLSQGPTVTAGCGTATIDGTLYAGEWETAVRLAWAEEEHQPMPIAPAYDGQESGSGEVSPSQGALAGWLYVMNDANYLYLGTKVSLDNIAVDPDWWSGDFSLQETDEGNPRNNRWHADDCGPPLPLEGDFVAYEAHGVDPPPPGVEFHPWSEAGDCAVGPNTGVSFDAAPDGLAWEMRVNLNTSQLDKVGPGECFRFGSRFELGGCELGSGCGVMGGNWVGGELVWPEGSIFGEWPDTLGTLCLNPCEEEFVPEPGTILLLGSGLAGLAGYAALRRKSV